MKTNRSESSAKPIFLRLAVAAVATIPLLAIIQILFLKDLPDSQYFMPHGHCYLWNPALVFLHVGSDGVIALAYIMISATLGYLVYRANKDIPFQWVFLAFGLFIIACAGTHIMEVITLWKPMYWLSGGVKVVTALASMATAVILPPLIPRVLDTINAARVSEQRKLELESLYGKLKEYDELKTQFFANVSHELRTPLTLILGPMQTILQDEGLSSSHRQHLQLIERNANILLKHVNDLLDISKIEAGAMTLSIKKTDLAAQLRLIASNFETLAADRNIALQVQTPATAPAQVDPAKIERILLNLLSNAFKFTPDGGVISCVLKTNNDRAIMEVRDSGPGVSGEMREVIFERFRQGDSSSTRQFGGTGLGLSIVREFVVLHHGTVWVDTAAEGGARFVVEVPMMMSGASATDAPVAPPDTHGMPKLTLEELQPRPSEVLAPISDDGRRLILVVEDNSDMSRFITETLNDEYRVITAFNGAAGLRLAHEQRPDLIVTDVMMPQVSGKQMVQELRSDPAFDATPIVVLTARVSDELRVQLLREGAQDYLAKPFSPEELRVRIDNLIIMKKVREVLQEAATSTSLDLTVLANELAVKQEQLQAAKEKAETASQTKDRFMAILSHELRTPLAPAVAAIHIIDSDPTLSEDNRRLVAMIQRSIELEAQLIDDLLDLTQITAGKMRFYPTRIDAHVLLRDTLDMFRPGIETKKLKVSTDLDATHHHVEADRKRLQQVLWNILQNAAKFTPEGGEITINTSNNGNGELRIKISDTGIGIAPDVLPRIFDPFEQGEQNVYRQFGGLGLGLSISKTLIELHGGKLSAWSRGEGTGATFTIELGTSNSNDESQ